MIFNDREIKPYNIVETAEDVFNKSVNEPKVIVSDFDDTIALSTPRQIELLLESENLEKYKKYLTLRKMSNRFLFDRTQYFTCDWFKRNDIEEVPQEIVKEVTDFFNHPDFYKDVKPSKFAYALKEYIDQDYCKKIYVVSHCLSDKAIEGKLEWLVDFFKDSTHPEKLEFIPTTDTRKSIPIMEREIKWDIFADDRLECIYDMVLYGQGFGNEILIPSFGYNKPTEKFMKMVEGFNLQTFYMDIL